MIGPILFTQTLSRLIKAHGPAGAPFLLASALVLGSLVLAWFATREAETTA
jgi:hypothetical protein